MRELLERLWAIKLSAKNAHYYFDKFGQHLLADFLSDERDEQIDLINEVCFLGLGEDAVPAQDILEGAIKFVPVVVENDQENLSNLKALVKDTLVYIQMMDLSIVGVANLVGGIAQDLLQFHGLLYRQGILDKDDIDFLNNESKKEDVDWITVKGNHIPVKKGENPKESINKFLKQKKIVSDFDELKYGDSFVYSFEGKVVEGMLIGDKDGGKSQLNKVRILTPYGVKEISAQSFRNKFEKNKSKVSDIEEYLDDDDIKSELRKQEQKDKRKAEESANSYKKIHKPRFSDEEKKESVGSVSSKYYGVNLSRKYEDEIEDVYIRISMPYFEEYRKELIKNIDDYLKEHEGIYDIGQEASDAGMSRSEWVEKVGIKMIPTAKELAIDSVESGTADYKEAAKIITKAREEYIDDIRMVMEDLASDEGLDIKFKESRQSDSSYFEFYNKETGESIKIRFSDHPRTSSSFKYGGNEEDFNFGESENIIIKKTKEAIRKIKD